MVRVHPDPPEQSNKWGFSSFGRASALQAEGERFESVNLHHYFVKVKCLETKSKNRYSSLRVSISAFADK